MRFSVLSSGSRANCTFVEAMDTRILIDCGLSGAQTERHLESIGVKASSINAILVTHEHRDHINGIPAFSRRFSVPVHANKRTGRDLLGVYRLNHFKTSEKFRIGSMEITPVPVSHDAREPVGYVIESIVDNLPQTKIAQFIDLGVVTDTIAEHAVDCDGIILESNHDLTMLEQCSYHWELKDRIRSDRGHLSNNVAGEFLKSVFHENLQIAVLAHLSENSNTPKLAQDTVVQYLNPIEAKRVICAPRFSPTPVFCLTKASIAESKSPTTESFHEVEGVSL